MASDECDPSMKSFLAAKKNDLCTVSQINHLPLNLVIFINLNIKVCWESKCEIICINCGCSSHLQCLTKWLEKKQASYLSYSKSCNGCPVCRKKINIPFKIDTNRSHERVQEDDDSPVQSPWPVERGCILIRWITRLLTCVLIMFAVFWSLIILFALQERYEWYQSEKSNPLANQNPIEAVVSSNNYCGLLNRLFKNCA